MKIFSLRNDLRIASSVLYFCIVEVDGLWDTCGGTLNALFMNEWMKSIKLAS